MKNGMLASGYQCQRQSENIEHRQQKAILIDKNPLTHYSIIPIELKTRVQVSLKFKSFWADSYKQKTTNVRFCNHGIFKTPFKFRIPAYEK